MPLENLLDERIVDVDRSKLYANMGYPSASCVSAPVREVCEEQVARLAGYIEPWGSWHGVEVESIEAGRVHLAGGRQLTSERVAKLLSRAQGLEIVVVTLGARVGEEVRRLMDASCMLEAMALDAAGTTVTHQLLQELVERLCVEAQQRGFGTTIRYGPGYTGWNLPDIGVLFSSLEGEGVPVQLNEQLAMVPDKSLLNIVGLTPGGKTAPEIVPCRICDLEHCAARQVPFRKGTRA